MLVLVLKILLKVLIISAAFIASYLLIVILLSHIPVNKDAEQPHSGNVVYLTSDGIHIDVHLPVHSNHYDWSGFLPTYTFKAGKQVYEYITFGWGDWGFYLDTPTWAELKPKTLLKAAFLKTPTVMHVSYLTAPPVETKKKIKKIILSDDQMDVLKEHIQGSFKLDENGNPIMIPDRSKRKTFRSRASKFDLGDSIPNQYRNSFGCSCRE